MYDLIIIGKSLAGALAALSLNKRLPHLSICIIDQRPTDQPIIDQRATALSPSSIRLLATLEMWEKQLKPFATPIQEIHVGMNVAQKVPLVFKHDNRTLGYNLPNTHLRETLENKLSSINTLEFHNGSSIKHVEVATSFVTVTLENDTQVRGRLLIGADGRHSDVRRLLSSTKAIDYQQTAVTGTVAHTNPHNQRAFEFFLPQGPLAFIPLKNPHASTVVWSLKNTLLPVNNLKKTLSDVMQQHLGDIHFSSPIEQYPLKAFVAKQRFGHRWVLVGDAANAIHPVAGQGMNLAIRDIIALTEHLYDHVKLGLDIGSATHLSLYAKIRQIDRYSLLGITHVAAQWMTTQHSASVKLLTKGMQSVGSHSRFLDFFMHSAQFGAWTHNPPNEPDMH